MAAIHCLGGFLKKIFFCLLVCVPFPVPLTSIPSFYFSSCPALAVLAALSSSLPLFSDERWGPAQGWAVGRMERSCITTASRRVKWGAMGSPGFGGKPSEATSG